MKRLAVIVEGYTEDSFVNRILKQHLQSLSIQPFNLQGGGISVASIRKDAVRLVHEFDYVTTLVDYFGFKSHQGKPVEALEDEMSQSVSHNAFFPYIQKYEFEALLFADRDIIQERLGKNNKLQKIRTEPEEINHDNHPSQRLKTMFPRYVKRTDGIAVLQAIEWDKLREKCPRFSQWIAKLEGLADR